ncbi:MAG: hypothetical protein H6742_06595 [Alphaproteobacteria bacterium]|nr:hypothetical protein [Alphaproteobacteria bacterium]
MSRFPALHSWALLALLCAYAPVARAVGATGPGPRTAPTLDALIRDLRDGDPPERRLAARELRAMVAADVRASVRPGDELDRGDAQGRLVDHDARTAPACIEVIDRPEATAPCLRILGMLETDAARPAVEKLAGDTASARIRRLARWVLDRLDSPAAP